MSLVLRHAHFFCRLLNSIKALFFLIKKKATAHKEDTDDDVILARFIIPSARKFIYCSC